MKEVSDKGLTVSEARTKKFIDLVAEGAEPQEAARETGMSLLTLRRSGVLAKAAHELLERVKAEKLLDKKTYEAIARAKNLELMLQDENLKVALGAVKVALSGPQVAVQINNNLRTSPEVIESLKSLGLEMEEEEDGTGTGS